MEKPQPKTRTFKLESMDQEQRLSMNWSSGSIAIG